MARPRASLQYSNNHFTLATFHSNRFYAYCQIFFEKKSSVSAASLGKSGQFIRNDEGRISKIIDPRGVRATRNEYDEDGRLVATIAPDGQRIEFDHDLDGRTEVIRDRLGYPTVITYDDHGNV